MKSKHLVAGMGLLAMSALGAPAAMAADTAGFYGGIGVGYSTTDIDEGSLTVTGATASRFDKDDNDTGWKVFLGYQFNENFGLELGYVDLGKISATRTVTAPVAGSVRADIDSKAVFLDLVGTLPLQSNFSVFGKLGVAYTDTDTTIGTTGAIAFAGSRNPSEKETNFKLGLGLQYNFTPTVGVRGEWERYFNVGDSGTTGEGDIDLFSINLVIRF